MSSHDRKTRIRTHMAAHGVTYAQAARECASTDPQPASAPGTPHTIFVGGDPADRTAALQAIVHARLLAGTSVVVLDLAHGARDYLFAVPWLRSLCTSVRLADRALLDVREPAVVVVDGVDALFTDRAPTRLEEKAREGRSAGITLVLSAADAAVIPAALAANCQQVTPNSGHHRSVDALRTDLESRLALTADAGLVDTIARLSVGDRIRIQPGGHANRAWTVGARSARYVVAWRRAPFTTDGVQYTVIDPFFPYRYNGEGPGPLRSSLNTLGGGWDIGPDGEGCQDVVGGLEAGDWELSHRRLLDIREIVAA